MPKFNRSVKFTQEWKDATLKTIENRKKQRQPHVHDCATCQLTKSQNEGRIDCPECPIGQTEKDKKANEYGWCPTYAINIHPYNGQFTNDEKARLVYRNKMKRATMRRKVVE
jgi:hypothetical protein